MPQMHSTGLDTGNLKAGPNTPEELRTVGLFAATDVIRHGGDHSTLNDFLEMLGIKEYEARDSEYFRREQEKERQRKRNHKRILSAEQKADKKRADRERVRLKREAERTAKSAGQDAGTSCD